ncbi:MAG: hypothetical protein KIG36_04125 [Eubacteriales bacterium]|nr:hypothetical protein [Eubacteriales bacterium]
MTVNVYEQFFAADCTAAGVTRRAALVMLIADSEAGQIRYEAALTFFPHENEEDFAVSYDAYRSRTLYDAPGRRSRKREQKLMETFRAEIDALAAGIGGTVDWDAPLRPARFG